jgi:pimeloyl-ACP methyl ester carboxylesterase
MTAPLTLPRNPIVSEFVDAGDLRFEVNTCGDPDSERLALCLHGFPEHAYSWRFQLPALAELGYRVWAPNQRGYGKTTRPSGKAAYHRDHLMADVAALIDRSGAKSVTLVAHDWGALVAWLFAIKQVRPLERLVIMNLPHPRRFYEGLQTTAQQKRSRYERFFQIPWLPETLFRLRGAKAVGDAFSGMAVDKSRFQKEVTDVYRQHALDPGALTAMLNWYRANPFRETCAGDFPTLDTPTLMIWGEHDAALGKEMTVGTDELVSNFTLRYVNASHWVQQEAPDAVNQIMTAWLQDEPVPDPG